MSENKIAHHEKVTIFPTIMWDELEQAENNEKIQCFEINQLLQLNDGRRKEQKTFD